MSAVPPKPLTTGAVPNGRLPLEPGDRLTRAEFERRYDAMPQLKKAELIEGVVYMPSPVRYRHHGLPTRFLSTWLGTYQAATPGIGGGDNSTIRLDLDNEPQPDLCLFIDPLFGGMVRITADDYLEGALDLAVEVASSSASYDLNVKLDVYRRNGIQEYLVWRVLDGAIDWFQLGEGQYHRQSPGADGFLHSAVFPGLWLDPAALLAADLARVLAVLQTGTASPEHAAFVAKLAASATTH
jgi:Uma2 family endonuclease